MSSQHQLRCWSGDTLVRPLHGCVLGLCFGSYQVYTSFSAPKPSHLLFQATPRRKGTGRRVGGRLRQCFSDRGLGIPLGDVRLLHIGVERCPDFSGGWPNFSELEEFWCRGSDAVGSSRVCVCCVCHKDCAIEGHLYKEVKFTLHLAAQALQNVCLQNCHNGGRRPWQVPDPFVSTPHPCLVSGMRLPHCLSHWGPLICARGLRIYTCGANDEGDAGRSSRPQRELIVLQDESQGDTSNLLSQLLHPQRNVARQFIRRSVECEQCPVGLTFKN